MTIDPRVVAAVAAVVVLLVLSFGDRRRLVGIRQLRARYQCRAHRSVVLSQLFPEPWADRPYGFFLPKEVGA